MSLPHGRDPRLTVAMVAPPRQTVCGVADYTGYLLAALRPLVDVRSVASAEEFAAEMSAVDVVHIQHQYFLFGGVAPWRSRVGRLVRQLRAPAVMTVHEFVEPAGGPLFRAAVRVTNRRHFGSRAVRRLIVHTGADRERMVRRGLSPGRIVVIRHGVPPPPPLPPREAARRALGLEDAFVLTVFGFLARKKGHTIAIEALRRIAQADRASEGKPVALLLAGGRHPDDRSGYAGELEALVADPAVQGAARITGYLQPAQVAEVMSATDLVLAPFVESSGSGSLALALACGKPVLASDIAPHGEVVRETPGALALFQTGDSGHLAGMIQAIRHDPGLLGALARGARQYADAHTYERMAAETVRVYREVVAEGTGCASA